MEYMNAVFMVQLLTNRVAININKLEARSVIQCSGLCERYPVDCVAFSYHSTTSECTLIAQFQISTKALTKYWIKKTHNCPIKDGYLFLQHNSGESLCVQFHSAPHLKWDLAQLDCRSRGDDLVQLDTEIKTNLIQNHIVDKPGYQMHWWIGLKDLYQTNNYYWPDEALVTYSNWGPSQPDYEYFGNPDDCVILLLDNNFEWSDFNCDYAPYSYICEKRP